MDTSRTSVAVLDSVSPEAFDALAMHPMQSYAWGEARRESGVRVVRFGESKEGNLVAVFQMTVHKLPKMGYYIGYVPRSATPSAATTAFLKTWAKKEKIVFIKWEPYAEAKEADAAMAQLPGMRVSKHPLFTEWNLELDLTQTDEQLLAGFKKNVRYSIRHAETSGVFVREMNSEEGFKLFADLYFGTTKRQAYHGHTRAYHHTLWSALSKAGIARLYIAFYKDRPHAAFQVYFFRGRAYYPYSGSSDTDRQIPGTQLLMWEVIRAARAAGCTVLDLWGSLPPGYDKKHAWAGFTFFKESFGSRFVHMSKSYDLVIFPIFYKAYSAAYAVRKRLWKTAAL